MKLFFLLLALSAPVFSQVPELASTFDCNINVTSFSKTREDKIYTAVEVIKRVISTEEFRKKILSHKFEGVRQFSDSKGLSNAQIYKQILEGAERLTPEANNTLDLEVFFFSDEESRTIGYTYPSSEKVFINTKYFNKFSKEKIAANLIHEWLHKLGFSHDAENTPQRKYSVPYAVGKMVAKIGGLLKNGLL